MIFADRVKESSTSTGTGNLALAGASVGFQSFNIAFGTGTANLFYYAIVAIDASGDPTGEWETGRGYLADAATLVRSSILASSNSNAAVNFSAGTKSVFGDLPASIVNRVALPYLPFAGLCSPISFSGGGVSALTGFISLYSYVARAGTVLKGVATIMMAAATTHISGGLYDASGTNFNPVNLLASGSPLTGVTAGINLLPFTTPYVVPSDTILWFGWNNQGGTLTIPYSNFSSGSGSGSRAFVSQASDSWPNPVGSLTFNTGNGGIAWLY